MQWDVYCRVIDNYGDLGVAWRLAADLGARGESVRLVVDDRAALAWMAPRGAPGVEVAGWGPAGALSPDVIVETFGCGLPEATRHAAASRERIVCINLEHLSAEAYVERCHGLPSPRHTPGGLLTTWFYFPGFTPRTGGLLREAGVARRHRGTLAERRDGLQRLGINAQAGERLVSLFCYRNPALDGVLDGLAVAPTLLLLAPGPATEQVGAALGPALRRGRLRAVALPYLAQTDFDRLLGVCDLNFVRGEDSFVRAIWSGAPFVWQLYAQDDGAQAGKLDAFLALFLDGASPALEAAVRSLFGRWNGAADANAGPLEWPAPEDWAAHCERWRQRLARQADLTTQLVDFAVSRR